MSNLVQVTTYHRMSAMVNPDNPGFASYFRRPAPKHKEVYAIITNGNRTWREKFKVSNMKVAEQQIKEVIQFFNDTIRPEEKGIEKERTFLELYKEDEEVSRYEDDGGMSGWLDPQGVFHPCGFGDHVKYALDIFNQDLDAGFKCVHHEEMEELAENQHIPMSNMEQSSGSFISILGKLTPAQVDWFNRFFYKLNSIQKSAVSRAAKEQDITLKWSW